MRILREEPMFDYEYDNKGGFCSWASMGMVLTRKGRDCEGSGSVDYLHKETFGCCCAGVVPTRMGALLRDHPDST